MALDLDTLMGCAVLDLEGRSITLGEALGQRLVVLAFLRHFG